ncbi:MAG: DNA polymerase IV, partial [Acidimicrobiia bacterium]
VELRRLADRLGWRLRSAGLAGRTVTLKVRTSEFKTVTRSVTGPQPTNSDRDLFVTACELLETADRDGLPVRLLGIGVSQLSATDGATQLATTSDPRWAEVDAAVDAIRRRFGPEAVGPASAPSDQTD